MLSLSNVSICYEGIILTLNNCSTSSTFEKMYIKLMALLQGMLKKRRKNTFLPMDDVYFNPVMQTRFCEL